MKRASDAWAFVLVVALGLLGALVLSHWAACEQDDSFCAFTGVSK